MNIHKLILLKIKREHVGKERAIKREELLSYIRQFEPNFTDREMRKIYSELPICSCEVGVFIPVRPEELEEFKEYMRKKIMPQFERVKMVYAAYPHLTDGKQLELFKNNILERGL